MHFRKQLLSGQPSCVSFIDDWEADWPQNRARQMANALEVWRPEWDENEHIVEKWMKQINTWLKHDKNGANRSYNHEAHANCEETHKNVPETKSG